MNPAREALTRAINRAIASGAPVYVNQPPPIMAQPGDPQMIPRHPHYRPAKVEQHESARERMAREARDFLRRKAELARKLAHARLIPA